MDLSITTMDYKTKQDMVEARLWLSERELRLVKNMGLYKIHIFPASWPQNMGRFTVQQLLHDHFRIFVGKQLTASQIINRLIVVKNILNANIDCAMKGHSVVHTPRAKFK